MNRLYGKIIASVLALSMIAAIFTGCAGKEENKYNNGVNGMKISIKNDRNADKPITDKKFKKPELKENSGVFTITACFSSKMILQANMAGRIWGNYWGDSDSQWVALEIKNDATGKAKTFYGETDKKGDFEIWFSPFDYGGPYTVTIYCPEGNSVKFEDVLFGEVYVLGGQSNMGWAIGQCFGETTDELLYQKEIDESANSDVRSMLVWPDSSTTSVEFLSSCRAWEYAGSEAIKGWSACGYFFARRLNELYNVPVGVISACMGSTGIPDWMPTGIWYMGVVNPIKRLTVRGVCWYQGEGDCNGYAERLEGLIDVWRSEFDNPDLYWAAVELPRNQDGETWAKSRDEVRKLYGKVDKYTFAVTLDTGLYPEWASKGDNLNGNGEHPYEKLKVGERLADAVAYDFYGAEGTWTSPYIKEAKYDGSKITITVENVAEGLILVGTNGFQVRDSKGVYTDVTPVLEGKDTIVIDCAGIEDVYSVRYGWKNFRGEGITKCADSVCVYSVKNGEAAYPLEQFDVKVG